MNVYQNPTKHEWIREALPFFAPAAPGEVNANTNKDVPFFTNETLYRGALIKNFN